jgi:UDP-N-acetylmuramate dehydrogenase
MATSDSAPIADLLRRDEPLRRHTTWRIGGTADLFLQIRTASDLVAAVRWAGDHEVPWVVLGGGSNVLVADRGFRGLVLVYLSDGWHSTSDHSSHMHVIQERQVLTLDVAGCVPLARLARYTVSQGLAGLEWAIGIPGTVGGAIAGNAGAHGGCMADVLTSATIVRATGDVQEMGSSDLGLSYRSSIFRRAGGGVSTPGVILSARIRVRPDDPSRLAARAAGHLAQRRRTQPVGLSAGSVFRNPDGDSAGRLIEAAGLKGAQVGGACVSQRHANFIMNSGRATASDVRALIDRIRERVLARSGVELQLEVAFLGEVDTRSA